MVTLAIPVLGGWVKQHLNWIQDRQLQTDVAAGIDEVDAMAEDAAGIAYQWLVTHDASVRDPKCASAALDKGLTFMAKAGASAIAASGLTPETVAQKVTAKLGTLLASDPTVSVACQTLPNTHLSAGVTTAAQQPPLPLSVPSVALVAPAPTPVGEPLS